MSQELVDKLLEETKTINWQDKLRFLDKNYQNITFSTSFSIEDQIILDFICVNNLKIEIFAIDTGRLPEETYELWHEVKKKYKKNIKSFFPIDQDISKYVDNNGINAFYDSVKLRHECCNIRKVEPLMRAIKEKNFWISGVRREHNKNRENKKYFEFDANLDIIKFYPLIDLNELDLWHIIKENKITYNKLYDVGYKSIGCAPCSRAVKMNEDPRAGRWWWENSNQECGLHMVNGKLTRKNKNINN